MTCKEAYDAWEIPERELGEGLGIEEVFTAGWDAALKECDNRAERKKAKNVLYPHRIYGNIMV